MAKKVSPWIFMENPEIPWRIQVERFIPVEIFRKKVNNRAPNDNFRKISVRKTI